MNAPVEVAATYSRAVVERRLERDGLDLFPTPPWATRALIEHLIIPRSGVLRSEFDFGSVWEPAAGLGHMVHVLREYSPDVLGTDIESYGLWPEVDFVRDCYSPEWPVQRDWIITNPPFNEFSNFLTTALENARVGVCLLGRLSILETVERFKLFEHTPPTICAVFAERVPMHKDRYDIKGKTSTSYCWLYWEIGTPRTASPQLMWIPPGRKAALFRPGDRALAALRAPAREVAGV